MACEECLRRERVGLRLRATRRQADKIFKALCDNGAAEALGELWASGYLQCGPEDYPTMVETCLTALREYNEHRNRPALA